MKSDRPRDFRSILAGFGAGHQPHDVFRAFVRLAACALSCGTRESEYRAEAARWKAEHLNRFAEAFAALVLAMEADPFADLLGPAYMDSLGASAQQHGGEFHTPRPVTQLMAALNADKFADNSDEPVRLAEPACGSGMMILSFAEALPRSAIRRLRVDATDVNVTACDMCFVNTTLWGIPATIYHGNTLSGEIWAKWVNIHRAVPFLWRFAPVADDAAPNAGAGHVDAEPPTMPPEALPTPDQLAQLATHQGTPPTRGQVAELRQQLDFNFALNEPPAA